MSFFVNSLILTLHTLHTLHACLIASMPEAALEEAGEISKKQYFCNPTLHACLIGSALTRHMRDDRSKKAMREGVVSDMEAPLFRNGPHHFFMRRDEYIILYKGEIISFYYYSINFLFYK